MGWGRGQINHLEEKPALEISSSFHSAYHTELLRIIAKCDFFLTDLLTYMDCYEIHFERFNDDI